MIVTVLVSGSDATDPLTRPTDVRSASVRAVRAERSMKGAHVPDGLRRLVSRLTVATQAKSRAAKSGPL